MTFKYLFRKAVDRSRMPPLACSMILSLSISAKEPYFVRSSSKYFSVVRLDCTSALIRSAYCFRYATLIKECHKIVYEEVLRRIMNTTSLANAKINLDLILNKTLAANEVQKCIYDLRKQGIYMGHVAFVQTGSEEKYLQKSVGFFIFDYGKAGSEIIHKKCELAYLKIYELLSLWDGIFKFEIQIIVPNEIRKAYAEKSLKYIKKYITSKRCIASVGIINFRINRKDMLGKMNLL